MIKAVRIDHRLVHGQVAFSWTKFLEADCILVASDNLMKDELKMTAMKIAQPTGVKLVMKSIDDSIKALNSG
ncbi:PTS mannose/fructose/sorbose transporter subunit IIB, partial [Clostridium perfringens]